MDVIDMLAQMWKSLNSTRKGQQDNTLWAALNNTKVDLQQKVRKNSDLESGVSPAKPASILNACSNYDTHTILEYTCPVHNEHSDNPAV